MQGAEPCQGDMVSSMRAGAFVHFSETKAGKKTVFGGRTPFVTDVSRPVTASGDVEGCFLRFPGRSQGRGRRQVNLRR